MTMMLAPSKSVLAGRAEAHEAGQEVSPDGASPDDVVANANGASASEAEQGAETATP